MTKLEENKIPSFERKILQTILGGLHENKAGEEDMYNFELYGIYKQPGIFKHIKIIRTNWRAHIIRMPDRKILQIKVTGIRKRGRPMLRWTYSVDSDLKIINEKAWKTKVNERSQRKKIQRKSLAHEGLSCWI
ncbi:uncharacterized transposon-derived protein F52C9.6 [Trichonephila clavipes]|nr:uncharacterized transposon-derived protein F52C9.6 [Trichonephila clavipes]